MAAARRHLVRRRGPREAERAAWLQAVWPAQQAAIPLVLRAVDPAACRAVARRDVPGAVSGLRESLLPALAAPACQRRAESCPAVAGAAVRCLVPAEVSARLTMAAFPAYAAALPLQHLLRRLAADRHEAARRAPAVVQNAGDPPAEAVQRVARAARPTVGSVVSAHYAAAPQPEGRAAVCGAGRPQAGEAAAAPGAGRLRVAEEEVVAPDAVEARQPEAAAEEPAVAEGPQLAAAVAVEPDGVARPQVAAAVAAPHAAGLRPAVVPSVLPSASVCRPGRLRRRAQVQPQVPAPTAAVRFAHGRRSLQPASPSLRWSQAAQHEVSS